MFQMRRKCRKTEKKCKKKAAFDSGGSWELKYMLKLICTGILEVSEWSDSVADRRFRLGRVLGVKI